MISDTRLAFWVPDFVFLGLALCLFAFRRACKAVRLPLISANKLLIAAPIPDLCRSSLTCFRDIYVNKALLRGAKSGGQF